MFEESDTKDTNFGELFVHDVDGPVFFLLHEGNKKYTLGREISLPHQMYTKKVKEDVQERNISEIEIVHFDGEQAETVKTDLSQKDIRLLSGEVEFAKEDQPLVLLSYPKRNGATTLRKVVDPNEPVDLSDFKAHSKIYNYQKAKRLVVYPLPEKESSLRETVYKK